MVETKIEALCDGNRAVRFSKMHGAGNDYIYIDGFKGVPEDLEVLAAEVSDRHFGVGADGLVMIMPSESCDFRMRMFNADGSEAEMCGNATRCIGKFVFERGLTDKTVFTLETKGGVKELHLKEEGGEVKEVMVDMGAPILRPDLVPVKSGNPEMMISEPVEIGGIEYRITAVSMGNPHAIIFVDHITDQMVLGEGPVLEVADIFPRKSNIEFAHVIDRKNIEMRVWERGTGETLACGTGACATAVAAVLNGLTDNEVDMHLVGGVLHIKWDKDSGHVLMTGPAEFVCDGIYYRKG